MKKLVLVAAVMFVGGLLRAEMWNAPSANTQQAISIDYGGTKYSTSVFSSGLTTAAVGPSVVLGVYFSTGNQFDPAQFVDVWDSTGGHPNFLLTQATLRVYNNGAFSTGISTMGGGTQGPRYPIRFNKGIIWKPNVNTYNSIMLQYWNESD